MIASTSRHRGVARALARDDGDHGRAEHRRVEAARGDLRRSLQDLAEQLLVRAVRDDREIVGAAREPPGLGRWPSTPMTVNCGRADAHLLADRIDVREQRLPRRVARARPPAACSTSAGMKNRPVLELGEVHRGPVLGRADDRQLLRPLVAVVDARLRCCPMRAEPHVDERDRRAVALDRPRILDRQVRAAGDLEEALAATRS